jgi:hypothetical protein
VHSKPQTLVVQVGTAEGGALQTCPHLPQLVVLVVRFTHAPSQAVSFSPQDIPQTPFEQTRGAEHVFSQVPQWVASDVKSTQVPPQFVNPGAQAEPHMPDAHVATALGGAVHALLQAPQFFKSSDVRTQTPPQSV